MTEQHREGLGFVPTTATSNVMPDLEWPDDPNLIPDWIYTDERVFAAEQEKIFQGPTWNFVGFEAELPNNGDYIRS